MTVAPDSNPAARRETAPVGRPARWGPRFGPGSGGWRAPRILAGLLLLAAIVIPLLVHTYARDAPRLWGFPFFYWYQLSWVFIAALLVGIAFVLLSRDEAVHRAELTGGAALPEVDALQRAETEIDEHWPGASDARRRDPAAGDGRTRGRGGTTDGPADRSTDDSTGGRA